MLSASRRPVQTRGDAKAVHAKRADCRRYRLEPRGSKGEEKAAGVEAHSKTDAAKGLVVRSVPEAGESLRGYLLRLAEANGHPSLSWVAKAIWGDRRVGLLGPRTAATLAAQVVGPGAGDIGVPGSATTKRGL